jgi:dephospho-CoA kinase
MNLNPKYVRLNPASRLYNLGIPVIGLTGGISTGKSSVAKILSDHGLPVINADHLVKDVYRSDDALDFIRNNYPDCIMGEEIEFRLLREKFFSDESAKSAIEGFIYQRLPEAFKKALEKIGPTKILVYDVPLLFEKNLENSVDLKVVVYAKPLIQRARLMARDGLVQSMAQNIMDQQISIEDKRTRADFVVDNSGTVEELTAGVEQLLRQIIVN